MKNAAQCIGKVHLRESVHYTTKCTSKLVLNAHLSHTDNINTI